MYYAALTSLLSLFIAYYILLGQSLFLFVLLRHGAQVELQIQTLRSQIGFGSKSDQQVEGRMCLVLVQMSFQIAQEKLFS